MDWARSGAPVRISSLIRTFTVGSGIAPDQLALADCTAGLELRHASKMGQRFRLLRDPAKGTQAKPRGKNPRGQTFALARADSCYGL